MSIIMARTYNPRYRILLGCFIVALHMFFLLYLHFAYHELAESRFSWFHELCVHRFFIPLAVAHAMNTEAIGPNKSIMRAVLPAASPVANVLSPAKGNSLSFPSHPQMLSRSPFHLDRLMERNSWSKKTHVPIETESGHSTCTFSLCWSTLQYKKLFYRSCCLVLRKESSNRIIGIFLMELQWYIEKLECCGNFMWQRQTEEKRERERNREEDRLFSSDLLLLCVLDVDEAWWSDVHSLANLGIMGPVSASVWLVEARKRRFVMFTHIIPEYFQDNEIERVVVAGWFLYRDFHHRTVRHSQLRKIVGSH